MGVPLGKGWAQFPQNHHHGISVFITELDTGKGHLAVGRGGDGFSQRHMGDEGRGYIMMAVKVYDDGWAESGFATPSDTDQIARPGWEGGLQTRSRG